MTARRGPGTTRFVIALALVGAVVAGLAVTGRLDGLLRPGTSPTAATAEPTAEPPLPDAAACPIPAAGASIQLAESIGGSSPNASGGRFALCDRSGHSLGADATLSCEWSADRRHVRFVSGSAGPGTGNLGFELRFEPQQPPRLTIWRDDAAYGAEDPGLVQASESGAPSGAVGFRGLPAIVGPTATANPAHADGIIRWACDEAPPPVAGESAGVVRLSVDGVPAGPFLAEATCHWSSVDGQARQTYLETFTTSIRIDGVDTGVTIGLDRSRPLEPIEPTIWLTDPIGGGGWQVTGSFVFPLDQAADGSRGTVRFRGFAADPGAPVKGLPKVTAGTLGWLCDAPITAGPDASAEAPPDLGTRAGTGSLRLGNPLDNELPATATCTILPPDPDPQLNRPTPQILAFSMEATFEGERLVLVAGQGPLVLERLGSGARVLGEYVAIDPEGSGLGLSDADTGPLKVNLGRFAFEPTDPRYVPLSGPGGPARFVVSISLDCPPA
jgi:hypothetical protein